MVSANSPEPELLRLESIRDMLASTGPCITILLSPYPPWGAGGFPCCVLKSHVQEAAPATRRAGASPICKRRSLQPLEVCRKIPHSAPARNGPARFFVLRVSSSYLI